MSDLVGELRAIRANYTSAAHVSPYLAGLAHKAADEIERLEKAKEMDASDARQALAEIKRLESSQASKDRHILRALELLSLKVSEYSSNAPERTRQFSMCLAEDLDRINNQFPSPYFVSLSNTIREAWEELKMSLEESK